MGLIINEEVFTAVKKMSDEALDALDNLPKYGANGHDSLSSSFWYMANVGEQLLNQLEMGAKEFNSDGVYDPILGSRINEYSEGYFTGGERDHFYYLLNKLDTRYNHYLNFAANNPGEHSTIKGLASEILYVFIKLIEHVKLYAEDVLEDASAKIKEGVVHVGENG